MLHLVLKCYSSYKYYTLNSKPVLRTDQYSEINQYSCIKSSYSLSPPLPSPTLPRSTSFKRGIWGHTDDCVSDSIIIFREFIYSLRYSCFRGKESLVIFLQNYHICVTSKIQVNFQFNRYSEVLMIVSYRFSRFLYFYVFEVKESISDIPSDFWDWGPPFVLEIGIGWA